ncbi:MAG: OmpH family outer membrane protein, partial [Bacteroidales bacterium]|nr:OmpH family outer membrane protein [Bacteroidales bacterium]
LLIFAALFTFAAFSADAQKPVKLGHFNSKDLIQKMPDYEQAQNTLKEEMDKLRSDMEEMQKEVERLSTEYQAKRDQLSDLLKQTKEKEIQDAYNRLQTFQANSQQVLANKEAELTEAIYNKVKAAAGNVAKAGKYDYIFESNGILWYAGDSDDVTSLIEKELGLRK